MGLVEEGGEGGDFEGGGGGGGGGDEDDFFSYDVFLSHRQGDAQDFCRHLYEILTEKYGLRVFLDRASESLEFHDLPTLVRRSDVRPRGFCLRAGSSRWQRYCQCGMPRLPC